MHFFFFVYLTSTRFFETYGYSQLSVISPYWLHFDNATSTITQPSTAPDRLPNYIGSITGPLIYVKEYPYGCESFDLTKVNDPTEQLILKTMDKKERPIIMAVDRGECSLAEKIITAQNSGAHAVVVFDNPEGRLSITKTPLMQLGRSGKIPSIMISEENGKKIKEIFVDPEHPLVIVSLKWLEPMKTSKVTFDLWTTSGEVSTMFGSTAIDGFTYADFGNSLIFRPKYHMLHGETIGCHTSTTTKDPKPSSDIDELVKHQQNGDSCYNNCINDGRYCALPRLIKTESNDLFIPGMEVVKLNLLQICIRDTTLKMYPQDHILTPWWEFNRAFYSICVWSKSDFSARCAEEWITNISPSTGFLNAVRDCYDINFHGGISEKLHHELSQNYNDDAHISFHTQAYINKIPYSGSLSCEKDDARCPIFQAVCSAYASKFIPAVCIETEGCLFGKKRDQCGVCDGDGTTCAWGFWRLMRWSFFGVAVTTLTAMAYSEIQRLEINLLELESLYKPLMVCEEGEEERCDEVVIDLE